MEQKNQAVYLTKKRTFEIKEAPMPDCGPDDVILQPAAIGICGSDVHYWEHLRCGPFIIEFEKDGPLILGHESSAVVYQVGVNVKHLKVGNRVCIEPGIPCDNCTICQQGNYNLCEKMAFHATPPYNGTFQKFIKHKAKFCFALDKISLEEGALIEPLAVAAHACTRSSVTSGSHVLITGAGPIGIVCLKVATANGATKVIITDIDENRLKFAEKCGAIVINVKNMSEDDAVKKIKQFEPITQAFECSGRDEGISLCIKGCSPGAKVMTIGRGSSDYQKVPLHAASDKEIDILGSFRYRSSYKRALELVESGKVVVKDMITHKFELEEIQKAFELSSNPAGQFVLKSIIYVNKF